MEAAPSATYEVHVELFGEDEDDLLDALELLLGDNWTAPVLTSGVSRLWRHTHRNDAEHAGELARNLLEQGQVVFLVWLREPGAKTRRLLSGRAT
jgi:hypothetical protein